MINCQVDISHERKQARNSQLLLPLQELISFLNKMVIGQESLVQSLMIALLADGHLLVEGAPGLAKTRAIKALCSGIDSSFHRLQFTPDLLPADLTGTEIYRIETGCFEFQQGPLFHNLVLADEINRAPAKVQSALLEAMAERQITVGKNTYPLPKFFLVMATQNPIEQEGTYPLPEAQLDRFLLKVNVGYPDPRKEIEILNLALNEAHSKPVNSPILEKKLTQSDLLQAREAVLDVYMANNIQEYIVQLILATRNPERYGADIADWIQFGASPRASIGLARSAKALAFLQNNEFVGPHHVQALAHDILRHRLVLSYKAEAEGVTPDLFIDELIARVPVP
ncbi:MAG: MoxR family ATPase [Parachlamydiaceae bacterium]|nr:MoxR family ATPase [Parachlamydiaceae bacterium]